MTVSICHNESWSLVFFHLSALTKVVSKVYQANLFPNSENNAVTEIKRRNEISCWHLNAHRSSPTVCGSVCSHALEVDARWQPLGFIKCNVKIHHWAYCLAYKYLNIRSLGRHNTSRNQCSLAHVQTSTKGKPMCRVRAAAKRRDEP